MMSDSSAWKGVASVAGLGGGTVGWGATPEVGRCAVSSGGMEGGETACGTRLRVRGRITWEAAALFCEETAGAGAPPSGFCCRG